MTSDYLKMAEDMEYTAVKRVIEIHAYVIVRTVQLHD